MRDGIFGTFRRKREADDTGADGDVVSGRNDPVGRVGDQE
jgi:hypothetical protein